MPSLRFELRSEPDKSDTYYWQIVSAGTSATLAVSVRYAKKRDAETALNLVYYESREATYVDYT